MPAIVYVRRRGPRHASLRKSFLLLASILLVAAAVLYTGISVLVVDRFSTAERHPVARTPGNYGLQYETVRFSSAVDNIPLEGWFVDSPGSKVILMLHGRNGNRETGAAAMPLLQALVGRNYDVFMFDFRGHGSSGSARMSLGQFETRDVAGALAYLKTRGVNEVGVLSFSLGANTAINCAPEHPEMRAILADSVWAELSPVAEYQLSRMAGVPSFFLPGVTASARLLHGIDIAGNRPASALATLGSRPILLIHGTEDDLIPVANAYLLQKAAASNPNFELWIVPGSGHTTAYPDHPDEFQKRMLDFFDRYLQSTEL